MDRIRATLERLDALAHRWLTRSGLRLKPSIFLLRLSLGIVFLGFGALKFFPGLSPAEDLAKEAVEKLSLGLMPGGVAIVLVALVECAIGLCLLTGRYLRLGLVLLGFAMIGVLSPLVLFPDELFSRRYNAPTLEAQYVLKDVILLAAGLVVAASARGQQAASSGERGSAPVGTVPANRAAGFASSSGASGSSRPARLTPDPR